MSKKIIVVGGGASGLMAAIQAARLGASVTVLEQNQTLGKKILLTGNGRCNLTNLHLDLSRYAGEGAAEAHRVISAFDVEQTLRFFEEIGLMTTDRDGWVYPASMQASSVLQVLLGEAERLGIKCKTKTTVIEVAYHDDLWHVETEGYVYKADSVILSTGSPAGLVSDSWHSGHLMANHLGHVISPFSDALSGLTGRGITGASGIRHWCTADLLINGKKVREETGEVQFTDYGLSGIPIFQLCRYAMDAVHSGKETVICLDLLPKYSTEDIQNFLDLQQKRYPHKSTAQILCGMLPDKLASVCAKNPDPADCIKEMKMTVTGSTSLGHAQTVSGGICPEGYDPDTLESLKCPGLFFTGELLDVDGPCGGYNLQWAWSSGAAAGRAAAGAVNGANRGAGKRIINGTKSRATAGTAYGTTGRADYGTESGADIQTGADQ